MSETQYEEVIDFEPLIKSWKVAPRLPASNSDMVRMFKGATLQISGKPTISPLEVQKTPEYFHDDALTMAYVEQYLKHVGTFKPHWVSSIPGGFQEDASVGNAILGYLLDLSAARGNQPVSLWTVGNSEGVTSRTITHMGKGIIHSLNNNETPEHEQSFYARRPETAHLLLDGFFAVTPEYLQQLKPKIPEKFSVVFEHLSFQMYGKPANRREQMAYVDQFMERDGVFIALEKCFPGDMTANDNVAEYQKLEQEKAKFKDLWFTKATVQDKATMLGIMEDGMIPFGDLIKTMADRYKNVAVVWNSGSFYSVVASRDPLNVQKFCAHYVAPWLPEQYVALDCTQPQKMAGLDGVNLSFRKPEQSPAVYGEYHRPSFGKEEVNAIGLRKALKVRYN